MFDWEHRRVTGVYEDAKVDMPMPPGIQDDLSVQIALMVELLRGVRRRSSRSSSGNSVREYRYSRDGEETLTTPVGQSGPSSTAVRNRTRRAPPASGARHPSVHPFACSTDA